MQQETAEKTALEALAWVAQDSDLLGVFLGASGADLDMVKRQAGDPAFLAAVLDFVLMDDAWVMACAEANGWPYTRLIDARQGLPGGDLPNWT